MGILQGGNLGTEQEAFEQFYEAFLGVLFDQGLAANQKSVVRRPCGSSFPACLAPVGGGALFRAAGKGVYVQLGYCALILIITVNKEWCLLRGIRYPT